MYFKCPHCKTYLHINNSASQVIRGKCPHCGNVIEFDTNKDGIPDSEYHKVQNEALNTPIKVKNYVRSHRSALLMLSIFIVVIVGVFVSVKIVEYSSQAHFTIHQKNTSNTSLANADKKQQWDKFRTYYPYNFQTIAAKHYSDDSHVVILSEPADRISIEKIIDFFDQYKINVSADSYKCSLGYDGYIQDYVFAVNNIEKGKFDLFIEKLSGFLYESDYKPYYIDLSSLPYKTYYATQNLNYSISTEELQSWLIDGEKFFSVENSTPLTFEQLFEQKKEGLYFSETPGFVVWIMNKQYQAQNFIASARKFALESDLILGAIDKNNSTSSQIAIIGRERSASIYELPPLQAEMMLMLAATPKTELHQSYERNHDLAGKLPGGKDYAPILLSPELWHTEYGSLLNITDQMLKSWSENGGVDYDNFYYPNPKHWAFKKGVYTDLNTNGALTYNWNTAGAGYYINSSDEYPYRIYAVNRTGSLPVSYIPDGTSNISADNKVFKAEEKAYNFFSSLNNPDLVRVVQDASFYQIMKYYSPTIIGTVDFIAQYNIAEKTLDSNKDKVRDALKNTTITKKRITDYYERYYKRHYGYSYSSMSYSYRTQFFQEEVNKDYDRLLAAQRYYNRPVKYKDGKLDLGMDLTDLFYMIGDELQTFNRIYNIVPLITARNEYVQENGTSHSNWIKCPTIVQSWNNKDSVNWTGGHNLNSNVTPIIIDKDIVDGKYFVTTLKNGQKEIHISPNDSKRVTPNFLRIVNRTNVTGSQSYTTPSRSIRNRDDVMKDTYNRSERGFNLTDHVYRKAS